MNENSFKVVLIATAVLLMGLLVAQIRRRTRRFLNSAEVCLLRELVRSAQAGELQQEDQPKSLSGMTSIYLPQILRDFPEFNWEEQQAAVEAKVQLFLEVQNVEAAGAVRIHRTVISRYQKYGGTASILCETAAEYWPQAENGHVCGGVYRKQEPQKMTQVYKKQTVCAAELLYVYDPGLSGAAASVICPNCGAPVEKLGAKQCRYCGSVLHVSGIMAWTVQNVRERI